MQDPQEDPYNGKVLVAAIICLSVVVLFVVLLHAYGRWLLRHSRAAAAANEVHEFQRRRRSTGQQAEEAVVSARDDGLDAKVVAALPEFVYRVREQQGRPVDCVVCLSAMEEGERGKMLPSCGHRFHVSCIDAWLMAHSTCPICRAVTAAAAGEEVEVVVVEGEVVGGAGVAGEVGEVVEIPVGEGNDDGCRSDMKEDAASSSSTPSSCSSSLISCSLKRMLSRSRSDKKVFPSVLGN